jgi:hypothetical protein
MQPDSQGSQDNPGQPDTRLPQVFPAPQAPQNTTPAVPTPVVSPNTEQVQPTVYSPTAAVISPEPAVSPTAQPVTISSMSPITPSKKSYKKPLLSLAVVLIVLLVAGGAFALLSSKHQTKPTKTQTQSSTSQATQWPITDPDGSGKLYNLASLATSPEQTSVVKALSVQCASKMGVQSADDVVVDSDNNDFFNADSSVYSNVGNFVKTEAGCAHKTTTPEQAMNDYGTYSTQSILEQKGSSWTVITSGSTEPYCSKVDHIGIPPSILSVCFDQSSNQERAPQP